ncbi:hypothetical protein FPOA_03416 [Fusarium poae]|uniref:Fucose-specific lectin n=2 Tax=Fusarium poae TaxID=36050 RepID=A0A1B8B9T3_FUSPO|nr:hypothetical protein FPOA_03416 [Fusarium poae]
MSLLFICLVLVCILCIGCLILVAIVIKLAIHVQRGPPIEIKEKKHSVKEEVKDEFKKTIKKLGDPVQELFHSAQDHLKLPKNPFTKQQTHRSIHLSEMTSHIQHMTAVSLPDGNTIMFQVNEKYQIDIYESQTRTESTPGAKKYDTNTLKIKAKPVIVNPKLPVITAVAFQHPDAWNGKPQVRVYYVDRDFMNIREAYRVGGNGEEWDDGWSFNKRDLVIAPTSGLTANVFQHPNDMRNFQVKLYYQRDNEDNHPDVAFNVVGAQDAWDTRRNVTTN